MTYVTTVAQVLLSSQSNLSTPIQLNKEIAFIREAQIIELYS